MTPTVEQTAPIGKEQIRKAQQILDEYKRDKANLEQRIVENEQWYRLRHWECMRVSKYGKDDVKPTSAWLFNCLANKHADAMDNFPSPNILPREQGDVGQAKMLTSIIPVILDHNDFEKTYSDVQTYKIRGGTGVYGVFWDGSKNNGLGDVSIKKVDLLNLFWESGVTDIQKSPNFFNVELVENEELIAMYPQLQGKLGTSTFALSKYLYDDNVDTTTKSAVVDWYYKKKVGSKTILHLCKYVNDEILFSTENEPMKYPNGWYDHGLYPFVFDVLYSLEGTPTGFGYIDIGKDAQEYIDRSNKAIMENLLANVRPRYFIDNSGAVNEDEYADQTKDFVHVDGALGNDSVQAIMGKPLASIYVDVLQYKIDELKEVTGTRDISTGGTTSGVTAASAIAAMQEAGSKLARDNNKESYRAYKQMILMVIELIRQFYDIPRYFRILGDNGGQEFVAYSNTAIKPQAQGEAFGVDMGYRLPVFDVSVSAEKASPYSKLSQNELALQFYQFGFFNPQMADQALICLNMMDFDGKDQIMQKIAENNQMMQMMIGMATELDAIKGTNMAQMMMGGGAPAPTGEGESEIPSEDKESSVTKNARERVANSTSPV